VSDASPILPSRPGPGQRATDGRQRSAGKVIEEKKHVLAVRSDLALPEAGRCARSNQDVNPPPHRPQLAAATSRRRRTAATWSRRTESWAADDAGRARPRATAGR